jgi:ornithine cyclodeaminase/alanine dehydrogenase-like protein (mu-crystallin family)
MKGIDITFLSAEEIQSVLSVDEVITVTEDVYRRTGQGRVVCPAKISLPLPGNDETNMHWINSMPAFLAEDNIVGMKWVNVTSANRARSLPVTMGTIILNDAATGLPLAMMDGTWITHVRTGASVAIGAKYFARKDSKTATIIGAGSEGESAFKALIKLFDLRKINIVDIHRSAGEKFAREHSNTKVEFSIFENIQEAVQTSDLVILTTTARRPLMMVDWAKPGDFICTVSCFADLDSRFIDHSDKLIVDDAHCALHRIGAMAGLKVGPEKLYADICQVAAGKFNRRENDQEIITYSPAGMGAVDVALAAMAYRKAQKTGLGTTVSLINDLANLRK